MKYYAPILSIFLFSVALSAASEPGGVRLDGSFGYTAVDIEPLGETFSVSARVRVEDTTDSQVIVSLDVPAKGLTLYLHRDIVRMLVENDPAGGSRPGGAYDFAAAPLPKPGIWTHYLGTYDGRTIAVYMDGVRKGAKDAPWKRSRMTMPLFIGTAPENGRCLNGFIDDVRLWNRALDDREAAAVFAGESVSDGLIARWETAENELTQKVPDGPKALRYVPKKPQGRRDRAVVELLNLKDDGYRGIWYHNQPSKDEYVYKYSGGLGTYPANHYPFAVYAAEVDKTFFCYGGTDRDEKTLLHEVSFYDHKTGTVPRPTILLDKKTNDAHDNPVLCLDDGGYIWIFSTSHGTGRPSFVHRSRKPYDIGEFERISPTKMQGGKDVPLNNFSYFQIYHMRGKGFTALFTTYDRRVMNDPETIAQRILSAMSSPDGVRWSEWRAFAGILFGHYQSSGVFRDEKIGTSFNFHPNDEASGRIGLNYRSNLYYMETSDAGMTWRNAAGKPVAVPLRDVANDALVYDYYSEKRNVYIMDVNFDTAGNPVILYLTSKGYESGPDNGPRRWHTAYWNGKGWKIGHVTDSDNNYDFGSLYVEEGGRWRIIGTTETGPQPYNTGGEVAVWTSDDDGEQWRKEKQLTSGSRFNHCYPRRPVDAHPDFYAFWADGHGRMKSPSSLYYCNKEGDVFVLPRSMDSEAAEPKKIMP